MKATRYLAGDSVMAENVFKVVFCVFVVIGASLALGPVIGISDSMIFLMAIPNVLGLYLLARVIRREITQYRAKLRSGEIVRVKEPEAECSDRRRLPSRNEPSTSTPWTPTSNDATRERDGEVGQVPVVVARVARQCAHLPSVGRGLTRASPPVGCSALGRATMLRPVRTQKPCAPGVTAGELWAGDAHGAAGEVGAAEAQQPARPVPSSLHCRFPAITAESGPALRVRGVSVNSRGG